MTMTYVDPSPVIAIEDSEDTPQPLLMCLATPIVAIAAYVAIVAAVMAFIVITVARPTRRRAAA